MAKAGKTKKRVDVAAAAPQTEAAMKAELDRLRRELEEVKKERDFLKKAAAFFAQQNK
jgi:transposase